MSKRKLPVIPPQEFEESEENEESSEANSEDEEGSEAEDDELENVPKELFIAAEDALDQLACGVNEARSGQSPATFQNELLAQARKALEKAKLLLLALHPDQKEMLEKALNRNDGKVPPGSSLVKRSLSDTRYLLAQISFSLAKVDALCYLDPSTETTIRQLREALIFFPRLIEALHMLAMSLKPLASDLSQVDEVEQLLRKAVATRPTLASGGGVPVAEEDLIFHHREIRAASTAQQGLALMQLQSDRAGEAVKHLQAQRFTWHLSSSVLNYSLGSSQLSTTSDFLASDPFVQCFDDALSDNALRHLSKVFRPDGNYWREHLYDLASNSSRTAGYVSYLYPLRDRSAMNSIEQIIDSIFRVACHSFPSCLSECTIAEWWVHSRSHPSGHQMHFDSDETKIESGGLPNHPICSTVLYVSEDEPRCIGGPTLVTSQSLDDRQLATNGWLCHPKRNRLCVFDGTRLHGVIPGKGPNPAPERRRLTFMVGFWRGISAKDKGLDNPGAGQPFPDLNKTKFSWPAEMSFHHPEGFPLSSAPERLAKVAPLTVEKVWEPLDPTLTTGTTEREIPAYNQCFMGF